jgi:hypothetical protein
MIKIGAALNVGAALCFAAMLAQSIAQGAELRGNFSSGDSHGNISASIGDGGMSAKGSVNGRTSGSGSLSFGSGTATNGGTSFSTGNNSLALSFGQSGLPGTTPGPGSPVPSLPGANLSGIAAAIGELSIDDQRRLAKKCVSVLAAPNRHDPDTVIVCRVLASL